MKKVNKDRKLTKKIRAALRRNKQLYGYYFCPSVPLYKYSTQNAQDYVCPCKDFRENKKNGELCNCGLYIKKVKGQDSMS